jgi:hypothetical protein
MSMRHILATTMVLSCTQGLLADTPPAPPVPHLPTPSKAPPSKQLIPSTLVPPSPAPSSDLQPVPEVTSPAIPFSPYGDPAVPATKDQSRIGPGNSQSPPASLPEIQPLPEQATPGFIPGMESNMNYSPVPQGGIRLAPMPLGTGVHMEAPQLYQPSPGTYPAYPSQYNAFSTSGLPDAPTSYSPYVGTHDRYPYYSYRHPWYTPGAISRNVNIIW